MSLPLPDIPDPFRREVLAAAHRRTGYSMEQLGRMMDRCQRGEAAPDEREADIDGFFHAAYRALVHLWRK